MKKVNVASRLENYFQPRTKAKSGHLQENRCDGFLSLVIPRLYMDIYKIMYVCGKKKQQQNWLGEQKGIVGRGRNRKGKVGWGTEEKRI